MKHFSFCYLILALGVSACSPHSASMYGRKDLLQPAMPQAQNFTAPGNIKMADLLISTNKNTPVEFNAKLLQDNGLPHTIAVDPNKAKSIRLANGLLEVIDPVSMRLRYTPDNGFTGEDNGLVYIIQDQGTGNFAAVRIQVENPIRTLQPALAVRGTGCIMCHASVASNIMTDFGYGDNYFFGGPNPGSDNHTSIYSDESVDANWHYVKRLGAKVIVPQASTTDLKKVPAPSLAGYLRQVIGGAVPAVRSTQVTEVKSMYIGAPTADRIRSAAKMISGPEQVKYIQDPGQPATLPALIHHMENGKDYFTNDRSKPFICSGDLVVDGVLYLNRPVIQTQTGCRIYVTKSVFTAGEIIYSGGNPAKENLQIVSARSINMGLGKNTCGAPGIDQNSLSFRLHEEPRRIFFDTRGDNGRPVQDNLDTIYDEADQIGVDNLLDAACEPGKARQVAFKHLILNAPIVFSRYQGNFNGSIIAEIALMSLDKFVFQFDPIFTTESVLPLLSPNDYLTIQ